MRIFASSFRSKIEDRRMHHRDEGDILPDIVDHFQQVHKNLDFYPLDMLGLRTRPDPLIVESFLIAGIALIISR